MEKEQGSGGAKGRRSKGEGGESRKLGGIIRKDGRLEGRKKG